MQQKATAPVIIIGVIVLAVVIIFVGKHFMGSAPTNTGAHVLPSFIDPATNKPKAGVAGGSGVAQPMQTGTGNGGYPMPAGGGTGGR